MGRLGREDPRRLIVTVLWHMAQVNVGRLVAPPGHPAVAGFMAELDRINTIADRSPGFIWRLQDTSGNATGIRPTSDPLFAINMSLWSSGDALFDFVYRSAHTPEMARRKEFFERFDGAYQALWWVAAGHVPTIDEALSRLWRLDRYGPTAQAFTFKARFPAPNRPGPAIDMNPDPWCAGRA